jgi:hypothetical protein
MDRTSKTVAAVVRAGIILLFPIAAQFFLEKTDVDQ